MLKSGMRICCLQKPRVGWQAAPTSGASGGQPLSYRSCQTEAWELVGMATSQNIEDGFDQVIQGASQFSAKFLQTIQARCNEANIGLSLQLAKRSRKDESYVLRGDIVFGDWRAKRPFTIEVFADPIGQALHAGWQLTTSEYEIGGIFGATTYGSFANARSSARQTKIHNDPNTQRRLSAILQSFNQVVFIPTLQQLADAAGGSSGPRSGFLGT